MIQQPLNFQRKSAKLAISYIFIILLVQMVLQLICFPFFVVESLQFLKTVTVFSLLIFVVCGIFSWYTGPGFVERDQSISQTELLERFPVHEICFEC